MQRFDKSGNDLMETIFPFKYLTKHIILLINKNPNISLKVITYFFLTTLNFISGPIMILKNKIK
jgi:hypothetical protein